jgi:two-component system sensor histidine kinase AdeS
MQCLTVLFDNALKYASSRSLRVKNGIAGKENFILVEDSGQAFLRNATVLFQPFQRGEQQERVTLRGAD